MNKYPAYWLMTLALLILIVGEGCGKRDEKLPEVVVDRSECAKCRMLISDARFSGLLKTSDYLMFDDIGCMLKYEQKLSPQETQGTWVRDYFTNTWIAMDEAIFYRIDAVTTPMEYGYIAASKKNAEPAVAANAELRIDDAKALHEDFAQRFAKAQ